MIIEKNSSSREFFSHVIKDLNCCENVLEIGALHRPFVETCKPPMATIKYLDHASRDDLVKKYSLHSNINPEEIVDIDYVLNGSVSYDNFIKEKFDLVFSSHCIEHQADIIGHVNSVANILNKNGYYVLLVPDFRYVFDSSRPMSTLSDMIDAHWRKLSKPSFRDLLEHTLLTKGIGNNSIEKIKYRKLATLDDYLVKQIEVASENFTMTRNEIDLLYNSQIYRDAHVWKLIPESAYSFFKALYEKDIIKLYPQLVYKSSNINFMYEFGIFFSFQKNDLNCITILGNSSI